MERDILGVQRYACSHCEKSDFLFLGWILIIYATHLVKKAHILFAFLRCTIHGLGLTQ